MYWDLVYAYENVKVQKESLSFAERTLSDTKKQVEIGTMAPIETVRAQSTVATDQQQLTVALTNLQLEQLLMKNAITRTLVDPVLADAEVIPTSSMEVPQEETSAPTENFVNEALSHRPDLAEARINLTNTGISNKAIRNALLPALDLFGYYSGSGIGGSQNPGYICSPQFYTPLFCGNSPTQVSPVSYTDTLNSSSTRLLLTKVWECNSNIPFVTALARRCKRAPSLNIGRRNCAFNKSKTRCASKSATRCSAFSKIAPALHPPRLQSIWRASRSTPSRRSIHSARRHQRLCCKTRLRLCRPSPRSFPLMLPMRRPRSSLTVRQDSA